MEPFSNFSSTSWGTSLGRSPEVGLMLGFGHTQLQAPWTSSHSCYISFKSTGRPAEGCMGSWHMVVQSLCRWIQNYPVCGCVLGASCSSSGDEICITAHLFFYFLFLISLGLSSETKKSTGSTCISLFPECTVFTLMRQKRCLESIFLKIFFIYRFLYSLSHLLYMCLKTVKSKF